jgi:hypothetical protein
MMKTKNILCIAGMFLLTMMWGCDRDEADVDMTREEHRGRGSEACQDWQYAACTFWVSKCQNFAFQSLSDCLDLYAAHSCRSDVAATDCVARYETAECSQVPAGCSRSEMTDRASVVANCEAWLEAICENNVACGHYPSVAACLDEAVDYFDCTRFVGTYMKFEGCIDEIRQLPCDARMSVDCRYVFTSL